MDTITLNGIPIEVSGLHDSLPMVKFKNVKNWCKVSDAFIPNITAIQWLLRLGNKGFWNHSTNCQASNGELRRYIEQGVIRFNGKIVKPNDMLNFPILSVVLFPKSDRLYTTIY